MKRLRVLSQQDRYTLAENPRPKTYEDCLDKGSNEQRPCPWVSCRYHTVSLKEASRSDAWMEGDRETCVLDVASEGAHSYQAIADALNLNDNMDVIRIEQKAIEKIKAWAEEFKD